jgi:hypothetical protein
MKSERLILVAVRQESGLRLLDPGETDLAPYGTSGEFIDQPRVGFRVMEVCRLRTAVRSPQHPLSRAPDRYPLDSGFRVVSIDERGNEIAPGGAGQDPAPNPRRRPGELSARREQRPGRCSRLPPSLAKPCSGPVRRSDLMTCRAYRSAIPVHAGRSRATRELGPPNDGWLCAHASTEIDNVHLDAMRKRVLAEARKRAPLRPALQPRRRATVV